MLGLNMFSLLVFTVLNIFAVLLGKSTSRTRSRILRVICTALLSFNLCRYALALVSGRGFIFPVEFSSVAYFVVPAILLTRIKKAQCWAAYSGLIAGFFYYATLIVAGGSVYAQYRPYDIYISLYCHGSLYLCGLVSLKTNKYEPSDRLMLLAGNVFVILNAVVLRPIAEGKARIFIYELMDGLYVKQVFPEAIRNNVMPVYYILMIGLIWISISLFYKLNKVQYEKHMRTHLQSWHNGLTSRNPVSYP